MGLNNVTFEVHREAPPVPPRDDSRGGSKPSPVRQAIMSLEPGMAITIIAAKQSEVNGARSVASRIAKERGWETTSRVYKQDDGTIKMMIWRLS